MLTGKDKFADTDLPATVDAGLEPAEAHLSTRQRALLGMSKYGTLVALLTMIIAFSIAHPDTFATQSNVVSILSQVAITGIIACGLTIALCAGDFDLSIGYVASFAGVLVTGLLGNQHLSVPEAIAVTLVACAVIGGVSGLLVTKAGVNSFIATLGVGTMVVGVNYAYNSGVAVALGLPDGFVNISLHKLAGVPQPVFLMAIVAMLLWVVLNRTIFGHNVQSVGGNAEAARLGGVRVDRSRIGALMISAVCAGGGGILLAAQLGSGQSTAGDSYLLAAFAAAFLGSVALRDGEFHVVGTLIGVFTVGVAFDGLAIVGAATYWQYIFNGGLLVLGVAMSTVARRLAAR